LNALEDWKEKLFQEKRGLPKTYKSHHEFQDLLRVDLENVLKSEFCERKKRVVEPPAPDFQKAEEKYQNKLRSELNTISLLGSSVIQPFPLRLKDIFVPLEMYDGSGGERGLCSIVGNAGDELASHWPEHVMQETFKKYSVMLVIGDPGSGKTTLMKYYALTCLDANPPLSQELSDPVRVFFLPLRELSIGESLSSNLSAWSERNYLIIEPAVFDSWLDGDPSLVLLDGLDEVSDPQERKEVCRWVGKMIGVFSKAKFVVTSRPTVLRAEEGISFGFEHQRVTVKDFSQAQQIEFLNNWYQAALLHGIRPAECSEELWEQQQKGEAKKLTDAIVAYLQKPENKGIRELAAIPMLLQIMAILWKDRKFLPGRRQELYSAALDYLLDYRDRERNLKPLLSADDARRVLAPVALWMQEILENDEADRNAVQAKIQETLDGISQPYSVEEICRNLVDRAGVLVEHGKATYVFRHKTFREYLAGVQLKEEWFEEGRLEMIVQQFGEESGWWDEVILFLMGQSNGKLFDKFMKLLFASPVSDDFTSKQKALLSQVVEESPEKSLEALCSALLDKTATNTYRQRSLLVTLKAIALPKSLETLHEFRTTGLALNNDINEMAEDVIRLIQKFSGVDSIKVMTESRNQVSLGVRPAIIRNPFEYDAQYILIPGGIYIFSVMNNEITVPDIYFAKYPVTNRQYRSFIGFLGGKPVERENSLTIQTYTQALHELANSRSESVEGFADYLKGESDLVKRFASGRDGDRKFNKDDQPVSGVTFFDARTYCLWLSMLSGSEYRLPTEEEWEWAAGGRREEPGRVLEVNKYPWGDKPEPTPKHANFNENEGATTPVGRYPDGATPEGLYDMAGNVWEWMENWYDNDKDVKALRGGSWLIKPEDLRCSARGIYDPDGRNYDLGFRVVRPSPVF